MNIEKTINDLAQEIHSVAEKSGFHEDYYKALQIISASSRFEAKEIHKTLAWFDNITEQAEISRMHSELSEWVEGIRHNDPPDQHLPHLTSAEVEAADCIIRILDTCAKRGYKIGQAIVDKIEYNKSRPYKHGKTS